ncbi:cadherin repeat domain-containing protein [Vibrio kasasachensis]|uniref:cadherin repeat domain-containing protein n=1 Tax=Vibrio kasasachensis TaxID=2910248 RepID=UPI003D0E5D4D
MNIVSLAPLLLADGVVVINGLGQARLLQPGENAGPGEVIISQGNPQELLQVETVDSNGQIAPLNLDPQTQSIVEQLESGQDPTISEEFAPEAGEELGSSPTVFGAISRDGSETIATTLFETRGLESVGLSETQSLSLLELLNAFNQITPEPPNAPPSSDNFTFSYAENSADDTVIGTVIATDPEGLPVTYSIEYGENDPLDGLFEITDAGEISLTPEGVETFTNDFESDPNSHQITVVASDGVNETPIVVTLNETDVNEPPVFDPPEDGDEYIFCYDENSVDAYVIGSVNAVDPEGGSVTYSIEYGVNDPLDGLFEIDADGNISLTAEGVDAFTNDFETLGNQHQITVIASDGVNDTPITVKLHEQDLNEPPVFDPPEDGDEYIFCYDENSVDAYVIGSVNAVDPEGGTVTYSIEYGVNDPLDGLFEIDADGNISLTAEGVDAFTNDFETLGNQHQITVIASDGVNDTPITVKLHEQDLNEPPVFDPPEDGDEYIFCYDENSVDAYVIGSVNAVDPEGGTVTYSIEYGINDPLDGLFEIDADGNISLTAEGVDAFTNDFETLGNQHQITVIASDGVNETPISVKLHEQDVYEPIPNNPPEAEDFNVDAGAQIMVPITFDSLIGSEDHISDIEDDANDVKVKIMITSLPESGELLYTDESGVTRKLTEDDLHVLGDTIDPDKLFISDNIAYVPGNGDEFELGYSGDPEDIVLEDGFFNWGEYVSDTERLITLENGNTVGISITDNNDKPLKQYTNGPSHIGYGIGDTDGSGMNKKETLAIDLTNNPLAVITLGLDGMGGHFVASSNVHIEATYTLQDGTVVVEKYQKDPGDVGNEQILYEFTYSSPDNPVVGVELSSNGGSWELRYLSGLQNSEEEVTFDYIAVDSDLAVSNEAEVVIDTSDSTGYTVLAAENEESLEALLGNDLLIGDEGENVFTWLDATLDSGTDVVKDFTLNEDLINLDDLLDQTDSADIDELMAKIGVSIVDENIELSIPHGSNEQTIVIENGVDILSAYIAPDDSYDSLELLAHIIKNDAA